MEQRGALGEASAPQTVSKKPAASAESITKRGVAPFAAEISPSIATLRREPVVQIAHEICDVEVFDLTVDEAHCFFAAEILVHNCHDALQYTATQIFGTQVLTGKTAEDFEREQAQQTYDDRTRSQQTGY